MRLLLEAAPAAALERVNGDAGGLEGATPLYLASQEGHTAAACLLLAAAPQAVGVLAGQNAQRAPLHVAVRGGHLDVMRLILEAAPHAALIPNSDGHLPIHYAAAVFQHGCGPRYGTAAARCGAGHGNQHE